ncbi:hypothetical protein EP7_005351 [Isosphaeraceae bacterium EP7]
MHRTWIVGVLGMIAALQGCAGSQNRTDPNIQADGRFIMPYTDMVKNDQSQAKRRWANWLAFGRPPTAAPQFASPPAGGGPAPQPGTSRFGVVPPSPVRSSKNDRTSTPIDDLKAVANQVESPAPATEQPALIEPSSIPAVDASDAPIGPNPGLLDTSDATRPGHRSVVGRKPMSILPVAINIEIPPLPEPNPGRDEALAASESGSAEAGSTADLAAASPAPLAEPDPRDGEARRARAETADLAPPASPDASAETSIPAPEPAKPEVDANPLPPAAEPEPAPENSPLPPAAEPAPEQVSLPPAVEPAKEAAATMALPAAEPAKAPEPALPLAEPAKEASTTPPAVEPAKAPAPPPPAPGPAKVAAPSPSVSRVVMPRRPTSEPSREAAAATPPASKSNAAPAPAVNVTKAAALPPAAEAQASSPRPQARERRSLLGRIFREHPALAGREKLKMARPRPGDLEEIPPVVFLPSYYPLNWTEAVARKANPAASKDVVARKADPATSSEKTAAAIPKVDPSVRKLDPPLQAASMVVKTGAPRAARKRRTLLDTLLGRPVSPPQAQPAGAGSGVIPAAFFVPSLGASAGGQQGDLSQRREPVQAAAADRVGEAPKR